jgi:hypothetical protein
MADDIQPGAAPAPAAEPTAPLSDGGKSTITASEAARILAQARKRQDPNSQAASAPEATPADESATPADAASPQESPGETTEDDLAPPEPALDPPSSWSRDVIKFWDQIPPEVQSYLSTREDERKSLVTRREKELETQVKENQRTLNDERAKMEQARQQYESALPALVQTLQRSIAGDFPEIRNQDDVDNLARNDPVRYIAWDASQKRLHSVASEAQAAQERQLNDLQGKWQAFAAEQDALFIKAAPEFADKDKAAALQREAVNVLKEIGFAEDELARNWNGQQALSLRDQRLQMLIRDAVRYRQAQKAVQKAPVKSVPPVTRPGAAPSPGRALESQIKQLESALDKATGNRSARIAADLQSLRRQLASR